MSIEAQLIAALVVSWIFVFLVGVFVGLRAEGRRHIPTREEVDDLRRALSVWAEQYRRAKPVGKHRKVREVELFAACTKVGLMWISPEGDASSLAEKEATREK